MPGELDRTVSDDQAQQRAAQLFRAYAAQPAAPSTVTSDSTSSLPSGAPPELVVPAIPTDAAPRYDLRACLGRGGGGEVFAVDDNRLGRSVAIKVMRQSPTDNDRRTHRFLGEARITASLQHPSILPVYDLGATPDGRLWFSMQRASGPTLADLITRAAEGETDARIRELADRVGIGIRICECIAYAHDRGVLHCDLKPANILLGDYGEVLVADWGTAAVGQTDGRMTGTPLYMSPEQARSEPADARSDIFGIAATLWHLCTLQPPISAEREIERFWELKRQGHIDPLTAAGEAGLPSALASLLRSALSADPGQRPQTARQLCELLRTWLRNREAEAACDRVAASLPGLQSAGDYRSWQRAEDQLGQVLAMAPGHPRADALLAAAQAGHAGLAIAHQELDLAADLLDPARAEHADALQRLAAARVRRQRMIRLRWGAGIAALLALIAMAGLSWRQHRAGFGTWSTIWQWQAGQPVDGMVIGLEPTAAPIAAGDADGLTMPTMAIVRLPVEERGDLRLTIDATWTDTVDGLELLQRIQPERGLPAWRNPVSLLSQFGGFAGSSSLVAVNRTIGAMAIQAESISDVVPARRYRLEMEAVGQRTILRIDGQQVLDHEELMPVGSEEARAIGLRAWTGGIRIHAIRVERLGLPPRPTALIVGDTLFGSDQTSRAVDAYLRVARDQPGGTLEETALTRACIAACLDPTRATEALQLRDRLLAFFPATEFRDHVLEATTLLDWRSGRLDAALTAAEAILADHPDSRIADRLLRQRPVDLPRAIARRLLALIGRTPDITCLDIGNMRVGDLEPLRGLRLGRLVASMNELTDLSPLQGMPLRSLDIGGNRITDIGPLRGMPLTRLFMSMNAVGDLRPLAGIPLRELAINGNPVEDLAPLRGVQLRILNGAQTAIRDLGPLRGMPLRSLRLDFSPISDLAPLADSGELRELSLEGCSFSGLAPLATCHQLELLHAGLPQVADLEPLRGIRLRSLTVGRCPVTDLRPLVGMPLRELRLTSTALSDVSPLSGLQLRVLGIAGSAVRDLRPLAGQKLGELNLTGCPITDLSPLTGLETRSIHIARVSAPLHPLARIQGLERIYTTLDDDPARLTALSDDFRAANRPALAQQATVLAAVLSGNAETMKPLARRIGQRLVLDCGIQTTWKQARELASRCGARLVRLEDAATTRAVLSEVESSLTFWIGLHWDEATTSLRWVGGQQATYLPIVPSLLIQAQQSLAWVSFSQNATPNWRPVLAASVLDTMTASLVLEWDTW